MLGWNPGPSGRQLLRVLFCEEEKALASWRAWKKGKKLGERRIDAASFSMLPLVAGRLESLGFRDDDGGLLAGLRKRAWYQGMMMLETAEQVLSSLEPAGAETVLLGEAAFLLACPGSVPGGGRELELTVSGGESRVDCLLRELGWSEAFPERRQAAWFERGDRLFFHGEADRMLFLRKSVFPEAGAAPPGRASTAEVRLRRCRARIPQTTSMLYGTLLRCADWRPYPPLHAMAKVFFLAGKGEADWDTVAEWSAEDGTERILRSVCGFFEKETGRPLKGAPPAASMAVFRKTSALVFMGGRAFCLSPLPLWFRYLDECAVTGSAPALAAFLDFLSRRWRKRGKADTLAVFLWDCFLTPLRSLAARVGVTVPARRFRNH